MPGKRGRINSHSRDILGARIGKQSLILTKCRLELARITRPNCFSVRVIPLPSQLERRFSLESPLLCIGDGISFALWRLRLVARNLGRKFFIPFISGRLVAFGEKGRVGTFACALNLKALIPAYLHTPYLHHLIHQFNHLTAAAARITVQSTLICASL